MSAAIEVQHVFAGGSRRGPHPTLKDVSFQIAKGELAVLIDSDDVSAAALLRILAGLERPNRGRVTLDGKPVRQVRMGKRRIGMAFDPPAVPDTQPVRQTISQPLLLRGLQESVGEIRLNRLARPFGLEAVLDTPGSDLTMGQRRLVGLARAMAVRPRLLLLDRPFDDLSSLRADEARFQFALWQRENAVTTVLVDSRSAKALSFADQGFYLHAGKLIQQDAQDMYQEPACLSLARAVGEPGINLIPGKYFGGLFQSESGKCELAFSLDLPPETDVIVGVWPEDLLLEYHPGDYQLEGQSRHLESGPAFDLLHVALGEESIRIRIQIGHPFRAEKMIRFGIRQSGLLVFDAKTGCRIDIVKPKEP